MTYSTITSVQFAKALADETRQEIMNICCCEWRSVGDIVDALAVAQPTVSHHLSILKSVGLAKSRREGKQVFYILDQKQIAANCCLLAENFAPEHELSFDLTVQ